MQDHTLNIEDVEGAIQMNISILDRMSECAKQIMMSSDIKYCHETADEIMQISRACSEALQMLHFFNYTLKRKQMQDALDNFHFDNNEEDT